jgi:hypothetical protein
MAPQDNTPAANVSDLLFVRPYGLDVPKLLRAGRDFRAPNLVASHGIFFEGFPISGGNRALGRQNASGRALCHPSDADKLGNRRLDILFANELL